MRGLARGFLESRLSEGAPVSRIIRAPAARETRPQSLSGPVPTVRRERVDNGA
jgi:hypothetical protein